MLNYKPESGAFIVIEGIDGSGKSTQADILTKRLEAEGIPAHKTFEPTNGAIGRLLRKYLEGENEADERAIAALFAADRLDHLLCRGGIQERVKGGTFVVTDRYYLSSYAYQSTAMPLDWVMQLNAQSARILTPDCHIFIDILPETAIARISGSREQTELFESPERLAAVRKRYFEIFNLLKERENIVVVDGEAPAGKVAENVWRSVCHFIGSR